MLKKNIAPLMAIIMALLMASNFFMVEANAAVRPFKKHKSEKSKAIEQKEVILIDPGHGGYDGGAVSKNGTVEKDLNLSIALKLKKQLESEGYTVYMTREGDESLNGSGKSGGSKKVEDLNNRCNLKKETRCQMFISIHQNTFPQSKIKGAQVWYSDFESSKILANKVQLALRDTLDPQNHRVEKPAGKQYRILRDGYEAPSIIVECGFITNPEEEAKLKDEVYQDKIATAIVAGVKVYFEEMKKPAAQ